jgi:ferredoxin
VLFDVYQILKPPLTILDGIIGMEGDGPSSGRPVPLGLILASRDALSLDQTVCDLLRLPRRSLMTNRVAQDQGFGKGPIEVVGESIERIQLPEFRFPNLYRMDWYLPGFLKRTLKNAFASRPVLVKEVCRKCHHCLEICPPKAIHPKGTDLIFDDGRCIRCFCCQEICPEGAISIQPGWASRFAGRR